jgi:hypothetical protein
MEERMRTLLDSPSFFGTNSTGVTWARLAVLAAYFFVGAFLAGVIIATLDVYWIGHPSPHSKSALLEIQIIATVTAAILGFILYFASLVARKSKLTFKPLGTVLVALVSGAAYSVLLGLSGQGVLILSGGTTNTGWILLLLLPIALSFLMRPTSSNEEVR